MFKYDSSYAHGWARILGGQVRKNPKCPKEFNEADTVTPELIDIVAAAIGGFALSDMTSEWRKSVHAAPKQKANARKRQPDTPTQTEPAGAPQTQDCDTQTPFDWSVDSIIAECSQYKKAEAELQQQLGTKSDELAAESELLSAKTKELAFLHEQCT